MRPNYWLLYLPRRGCWVGPGGTQSRLQTSAVLQTSAAFARTAHARVYMRARRHSYYSTTFASAKMYSMAAHAACMQLRARAHACSADELAY